MRVVPTMVGRIERRLLVNVRVDPDAVAATLPSPFRPLTVGGWAIAGVCLIRLSALRPTGLPRVAGLATENAAHRVAVQWDEGGVTRTGVWIPRRHTASRLTLALGGRVFPAHHVPGHFDVRDTPDELRIAISDADGPVVSVRSRPGQTEGSVFETTADAQAFFDLGAVGMSPRRTGGTCDAVELSTSYARLQPLELVEARSSLLERWWSIGADAQWDSAFVMRNVACRWTSADAPRLGRRPLVVPA